MLTRSTLLFDPGLVVSSRVRAEQGGAAVKLMNPRSGNVRSRMSFAYLLTFLRRAAALPALMSIMLALSVPFAWGASSPIKITIHIPGKSLT
jgi:hypothetical protein